MLEKVKLCRMNTFRMISIKISFCNWIFLIKVRFKRMQNLDIILKVHIYRNLLNKDIVAEC